ncbi:MAG: hypothetical protein ABSE51_12055 [Terracidiphilus sp.]|jgi:tetratricopeptide (TPR) repeat protein
MVGVRPLAALFTFLIVCALHSAKAAERDSLGEVHFPTSCRSEVRARFDSGIALLHSFEFTEAKQAFGQVEKDDPRCVIAAWGIALATTERAGADAPQKALAQGWAQLQPWLNIKAKTEREQMYVDAVRAMYGGYERTPGAKRWRIYLADMQKIRQKYPDDVNASLLYSLGLVWTAGSGQEGLARRRTALSILMPIFKQHPNNPGAAHYIIHAADTAELAPEALPAAREYAAVASDAPHALHMPSHIFNRLGFWNESIQTNQASARVAADWNKNGREGRFDELHALNNMEYGYLQLGQDEQAYGIIQQIDALAKTGSDAWLSIDARIYFDVETHNWQDAMKIEPPTESKFEENFDAFWIRTIAAAELGEPHEAKLALEDFRKSSERWVQAHGWGDVLHVALVEAQAWTLFVQGERDKAIAQLRSAGQFERDHPLYYADILPRPTAEMAGDMLLRTGRPAEALVAYKEALQFAPNRLDSLLGAMTSAKRLRNAQAAAEYAAKLKEEGATLALRP